MATILPPKDRFAGVRGFAENFVQGTIQNQQNQALSQQLGQVLGQPGRFRGITDPRALQLGGQLGQGEIQNRQALQQAEARRPPESQTQFTARIAEKLVAGTATEQDKRIFNQLIPPVNSESEMLSRAAGIRKEHDANQEFKNFAVVERQVGIIREAFDEAVSAEGKSRIGSDQALVIAFNKLLDPTSVVRESEFARTPLQAALANRVRATPAQIMRGGITITDDDRRAILDMAERAAAVTGERYNLVHDRFTEIADLSNVRPELVFGGIEKFKGRPAEDISPQPSANGRVPSSEVEIKNLVEQNLGAKTQPAPKSAGTLTPQQKNRQQELRRKRGQ